LETLYEGNRITEAQMKRIFWMNGLKNAVKRIIYRCSKCTRYRQANTEQLMGQIPQPRATISQPVSHTGIDYAGPINMRVSKGRGQKSYKGYIALFV